MEVILLERVEKLGQMGDVVSVKPGYARNYLLPQRKALRATSGNREAFAERKAQLEAESLKLREEAEHVAERASDLMVVIVRQASDNDHLYGSVTTRDIAGAVTEAGVTIDRRQVQLDRPIKTVGLHPVRVRLHPEVSIEVVANVARSEEEAGMQERGETIGADQDEPETFPAEDGLPATPAGDESAGEGDRPAGEDAAPEAPERPDAEPEAPAPPQG